MKLGVGLDSADPWGFFTKIFSDLEKHYTTSVFNRRYFRLPFLNTRINRLLFHHDLTNFMQTNDIVFFEWASELLATATHLPKTCSIITRLHRYELYQWANKVNWEAVDKVILVSKAKQQEFISRFPDQASKTVFINVSIPVDEFKFKPKPFSGDIGILCHLTPRKRVYDLILSLNELLQQEDNLHLHIAGGKHPAYEDYYDALYYIVKDLNLQKKVTFYGNMTDTSNWYPTIDIFISNSYSEGLQVAPMEAMASGCFCLSHRWYGADELLPEEHLFYTGHELREKILHYCQLSEPEKHQQRSLMRTVALDKFNHQNTSTKIIKLIDDVWVNQNKNGAKK